MPVDEKSRVQGIPKPTISKTKKKCEISCRYILAFLAFCGLSVSYALRVNLSIALVAMVNSTFANANAESMHNPECQGNDDSKIKTKEGEFNWNQEIQGIILGSFFYGYIATQIPGGWLAARVGGKHLFGCGILCTSIFSLMTPWIAYQGVSALLALRILEGLGEGLSFPAINALLSSWAPPLERSRLISMVFSGTTFGKIVALGVSGYLCESPVGWPSVFYLFGSLGIIWFIAWTALVHEKPFSHPRISIEEKRYILSSLGSTHDAYLGKDYSTPWLSIAISPAVWAILIANFAISWGFYIFLTSLPLYYQQVLNMNLSENGVVSAIPNAAAYLFILLSGVLADWLQTSGICNTSVVRKVFTIAGLLPPACLLVANSFTSCNEKTFSIAFFTLAVGLNGLCSSGFLVNHLDIAPRFAGLLIGISNTVATLSGIIAPFITGKIINNKPTREQWQKVFYLTAFIYLIGAVTFLVFSSAKEQPWNTPKEEKTRKEESVSLIHN